MKDPETATTATLPEFEATPDEPVNRFSIHRWGERHRVLPLFMSFEKDPSDGGYCDRLKYVNAVQDVIEAKPKTAKTITLGRVSNHLGENLGGVSRVVRRILTAFGAWQLEVTDSFGWKRHLNPTYAFPESISDSSVVTDPERRAAIIQHAANHGLVTDLEALAPIFGVGVEAVPEIVETTVGEASWADLHREGMTRWARTMRTLADWGYDYDYLAGVFGIDVAEMTACVERYTPATWEPPTDPTTTRTARSDNEVLLQ